ncbi:MAG: sodium:solute symporter family protein [Candidatus Delongbacteria bacterium]|jgi:SSS family solute:Na+ symporter|nr:sodium:solute symporter family protein [Candidatus Delongbacteria bacterium]
MNIYIFIIISYFALVILISFLTKKMASRSTSDFLVAGRNLGVIVCAVVVAAEWLGGMSTIGVSEQAFNTGTLRPILYNIATATGMIIIGFTVASHYRKKDVHTVSEMLKFLFGDNARTVSAIAFLLAYITLAYVQLQTCAGLFGPLLGLDWTTSILISSVIITLYTYIGGMHALAITGVIHVVVMFIGIGIATFIGMDKVGGFAELQSSLMATGAPENFYNPFSGGMSKAFSLLLGGILGGMAGQASIQPIFAAKNAITAKRAAIVSSLIIAPFGIMIAFLGLIAKTGKFFEVSSITNPKMVLSTLLTTPEFIHPVLGGLALAGVLAAILSTVGPVNFAIVTIATKDIYQGIIHKKVDDKKLLKTAKNMVLLVNVITIPLAIFIHGAILEAAYVSYAIRAIGAIVIILGIYKRNWITSTGVVLAFIGGTITIFVCILANKMGWFSVDKTYGAIISAVIFILIGNLWEKSR